MMRYALIPAVFALAACEGGMSIPDFRSGGEAEASAPVMDSPAVAMTAKERLVSALEVQGCTLDINTIAPVMTTANVGQDELVQLVAELEAEGRMQVANQGAVRLISPACPASA